MSETTDATREVVHTDQSSYRSVIEGLEGQGFTVCVDVIGADYLTHPGRQLPADIQAERFEVIAILLDLARRQRVRVRAQVPESDPVLPTLFDLFPGAEAPEREVFDMYGIRFEGHPDMTRILMPEDWEGYPLRKDYAVGRIPVQFKGAPGPT